MKRILCIAALTFATLICVGCPNEHQLDYVNTNPYIVDLQRDPNYSYLHDHPKPPTIGPYLPLKPLPKDLIVKPKKQHVKEPKIHVAPAPKLHHQSSRRQSYTWRAY